MHSAGEALHHLSCAPQKKRYLRTRPFETGALRFCDCGARDTLCSGLDLDAFNYHRHCCSKLICFAMDVFYQHISDLPLQGRRLSFKI